MHLEQIMLRTPENRPSYLSAQYVAHMYTFKSFISDDTILREILQPVHFQCIFSLISVSESLFLEFGAFKGIWFPGLTYRICPDLTHQAI